MKKKILISIIGLLLLSGIGYAFFMKSKCRATMTGEDTLCFDGETYHSVNSQEIGDYTETNHLICKTDFSGGWSVYEIKEYPDYQYVVVRAAWDAEVYKRD